MTADQRIFLRRHVAIFSDWCDDPKAVRRAVIRQGFAIGIWQTQMAQFFKVHVSLVYNVIHGDRAALTQLERAREEIRHAERALQVARGRERAALERIDRYGYAANLGKVA